MKFMKAFLVVCVGAFLGALIEGLEGAPKMITASVFGGLAAVLGSIIGIQWLCNKIWPGRDKWVASSSYPSLAVENDPQRAIDRGKEWRSSSPQKPQQWFRIDLAKERMVASINFEPDEDWIENPKKWRMMFHGENRNISVGNPIDGEGFIFVGNNYIPRRIQYITVYIKEPMDDMPEDTNYAVRYGKQVLWTISLRIKEFRFSIFGKRFWKHEL